MEKITDSEKIIDSNYLLPNSYIVIRKGKKDFYKINVIG
jgi:tyrosyl-tRNA synthetase